MASNNKRVDLEITSGEKADPALAFIQATQLTIEHRYGRLDLPVLFHR